MDCKAETPKDQCENQQHENYSHYVLFPMCLWALAMPRLQADPSVLRGL